MRIFSGGGDTIFSFHIILEGIPISWILLEFQRNLNIFSNLFLLINIIEGDRCMNVRKNLGMFRANLIGFIPGYLETIWYDPKGISNILSMEIVEKYFSIIWEGKYSIVNKYGGIV